MKCNKKLLQLFAALWIMAFHIWIPLSNGEVGSFILKIGYIGVDIFFFLAAYSLADKEIKYPVFLKNRFFQIYLKFVLFVIIAAIYKGWKFKTIIKTLTGADLFIRGGGSFLWFVPAVMIFYIIFPLLKKCKLKLMPLYVIAAWLGLSLLSEKVFGYTDVFIFTNRIPVITAGYLLKKYKIKSFIPAVCLPVGIYLLYEWGFMRKLHQPIRDFYFVLGVLVVIGIVWLSGFIPETKAVKFLGSASLEMYALQMIFGPALVTKLYRLVENKALTNAASFAIIIVASIIMSQLWFWVTKFIKKQKNKKLTPQVSEG